jgi:hypothetical protein
LLWAILAFPWAASAKAETTTHVFDASLSLTGDCTTETLDPVPDPGLCPIPPGVPGVDHPSSRFSLPFSEAIDEYGNLYVLSAGTGSDAKIDIFDPSGHFITEVGDPQAASVAVDGQGRLYVYGESSPELEARVRRYDPTTYNPAAGEIAYGNPPVLVLDEADGLETRETIAVDGAGHLYLTPGFEGPIREFGSAAEGNAFIGTIGEGILHHSAFIAIDRAAGELYSSATPTTNILEPSVVRVFVLNNPTHPLLRTIDGSTTPRGKFLTNAGLTSMVVDESTHHLFVDDRGGGVTTEEPVYELTATGSYVGKVEHSFVYLNGSGIAIDNGPHSPNSGFAPGRVAGYLFVPSGSIKSHLYAFEPLVVCAPAVEALAPSGVTTSEALLRAKVNPCGLPTHYAFEYTTRADFEAEGFAGALSAGEGELPVANELLDVSAPASGLAPGTEYVFRITATNEAGEGEDEGSLATYPEAPAGEPCPNEAVRSAAAKALLADCRAYELVTPGDTNGHPPETVAFGPGVLFPTPPAAPDGKSLSFLTFGGAIPGIGGSGSGQGDGYTARRSASGWQSTSSGPSGAQSSESAARGVSPDQEYWTWSANEGGSLAEPQGSRYIRYPDGSFQLVGRGSLATEPFAVVWLITPGGTHIIFGPIVGQPPIQLEPNAPPSGTRAIYDRTPNEVTHVVSLLPGEVTPAAGEDADFQGASPDGEGVAFTIGTKLYERLHNTETLQVAEGATFAGISSDGARVIYLKGGNLFAFEEGTTTQLSATANAIPVNVSADASAAYFVSPSVIHPGEENSEGDEAQPGAENLYRAAGGTIAYVATVSERDVAGEELPDGTQIDGLGLWLEGLEVGSAIDPSRTTPEGSALLFTSRADLTGFEAEGTEEVYRYEAGSGALACLSCLPTQGPPGGDADLETIGRLGGTGAIAPTERFALIPNISPDGRRAFFQSPDPLVPADVNGLQDVYEWEAQGKGSCTSPGGCVSLVSSGQGARPAFIFGASESGDDVFFSTSEQLLRADTEETPSVYDARVGGGFAEGGGGVCRGEACKPQATTVPEAETPGSITAATGPSGNVPKHHHHKHKHHHHKAGSSAR